MGTLGGRGLGLWRHGGARDSSKEN
jgi:hypothetical protein